MAGALNTITSGLGSVLSHPLFTRTKRYFERNRKGQLEEVTEDTWSICVGHAVFIYAAYTAWHIATKYKDVPADKQAELFIAAVLAGPVGALINITTGAGPMSERNFLEAFYSKISNVGNWDFTWLDQLK